MFRAYLSPSGRIPLRVLSARAHHILKSRNISRLFVPVAAGRPIRDEQKLSWPGETDTEYVERRVDVVPQNRALFSTRPPLPWQSWLRPFCLRGGIH